MLHFEHVSAQKPNEWEICSYHLKEWRIWFQVVFLFNGSKQPYLGILFSQRMFTVQSQLDSFLKIKLVKAWFISLITVAFSEKYEEFFNHLNVTLSYDK